MNKTNFQQFVIAAQFKLISSIAKGNHAQVYRCMSIKTGKEYAAKLQSKQSTSLQRQATLLLSVHKENKIISDYGLPVCYCFYQTQTNNFLVQDLFGSNLEELRRRCKGMFRINTFITLADQMVKRIEILHEKQYLHRAISLSKWAMGLQKNSKKLYLVGFSRGKHYMKNGNHIGYEQKKGILSELAYASINNHLGIYNVMCGNLMHLQFG